MILVELLQSLVILTWDAKGGAQEANDAGSRRFEPGIAIRESAAGAPRLHRPREPQQEDAHAAPPGNAASMAAAITFSTDFRSVFKCESLTLSAWQTAETLSPPSPYMVVIRP